MNRQEHVRTQRWAIEPKDWIHPPLKLALLSDLHICGRWTPLAWIDRAIAAIEAEAPDLILLLGDYAAHLPFGRRVEPADVAGALAGLSAPLGVYNIFGNHDWWDDRDGARAADPETIWHRAFDAAGIETVENRWLTIPYQGGEIILAGIASQMALGRMGRKEFHGLDDLRLALEGAPEEAFTILMAHEPDIFTRLPEHIDLTVSGHTHGGQIRPFGRALYVPSQFGTEFAYGVTQRGAQHLVVSGGIGYSGLPIRWRMPPEITIVELS